MNKVTNTTEVRMNPEYKAKMDKILSELMSDNDEITVKFRNKYMGIPGGKAYHPSYYTNYIRTCVYQGLSGGLNAMQILKLICIRLDDIVQNAIEENVKQAMNSTIKITRLK